MMNKPLKMITLIGALVVAPNALAESRASAESAISAALLPIAGISVAVGVVTTPLSDMHQASKEGNHVSTVKGEIGSEELPVTKDIIVGPSPKQAMSKNKEAI